MAKNSGINPDTYMTRPIEYLVFWAAKFVQRVSKSINLLEEQPEIEGNTLFQEMRETDEQMRTAYLVSLRLRSKEVVEHAASLGINCTEQQVKENPFLIVTAIIHHTGGLDT